MGAGRVGAVSGFPSSSVKGDPPDSGSLLVVSFAAYKLENFNIIYFSFGSRPPTPVYARKDAEVPFQDAGTARRFALRSETLDS